MPQWWVCEGWSKPKFCSGCWISLVILFLSGPVLLSVLVRMNKLTCIKTSYSIPICNGFFWYITGICMWTGDGMDQFNLLDIKAVWLYLIFSFCRFDGDGCVFYIVIHILGCIVVSFHFVLGWVWICHCYFLMCSNWISERIW